MRLTRNQLTAKYKAFRLQPNSIFLSRYIQTFFNKFMQKGKKTRARALMYSALQNLRMTYRRPAMYYLLIRSLRIIRMPVKFVPFRKGRKILEVPVPTWRNRRDVLNLQLFKKAVLSRTERRFIDRLSAEINTLVHNKNSSARTQVNKRTMHAREQSVYLHHRWK